MTGFFRWPRTRLTSMSRLSKPFGYHGLFHLLVMLPPRGSMRSWRSGCWWSGRAPSETGRGACSGAGSAIHAWRSRRSDMRRGRRLGADSSERDDMIGVDDEVLAGFGLDEPCKLHDRPASGVENYLFYVLGISLDAVALSGDCGTETACASATYATGSPHRSRCGGSTTSSGARPDGHRSMFGRTRRCSPGRTPKSPSD